MDKQNMLSAKKVKLHGIHTNKWTTSDKITQYKGVIKLYNRDKVQISMNAAVAQQKQAKEIIDLRNLIKNNRKILENVVRGDRQQLRNTLAEHREMQLAYQNGEPKHVMESIHQNNFSKRKELDRLAYKMKQKAASLTKLKLQYSILEDQRIYFDPNEFPMERKSAIIIGKVKDIMLKVETALAIQRTFKFIIEIMKKDAMYFDGILATLKNDADAQGGCMINAAKLGQLATEYLDDRKRDYQILEQAVRMDMTARRHDLSIMQKKVTNFPVEIKRVLRRDSDLNIGKVTIEKTASYVDLERSYDKITETLNMLKDTVMVSDFANIRPCFLEQDDMFDELTNLCEKVQMDRDILRNKTDHAKQIREQKKNSMVKSTNSYRTEKKNLIEGIIAHNARETHLKEILSKSNQRMAHLRIHLRQLQQIVKILNTDKAPTKPSIDKDDLVIKPPDDPSDAGQMVVDLKESLATLMSRAGRLKEKFKAEDLIHFERMIIYRDKNILIVDEAIDETLLEGLDVETSGVPTREDVKVLSDQIVEAHTQTEEYLMLHGKS